VVAVIFAVAATALLSAPAAWHRMLFRQGERPKIIEVANRHAIAGMVCLAVAMTFTVLLLLSAVLALWAAIAVAVLAAVLFAMLWFVLPLRRRWGNGGSS
jgi:hypothetical protein